MLRAWPELTLVMNLVHSSFWPWSSRSICDHFTHKEECMRSFRYEGIICIRECILWNQGGLKFAIVQRRVSFSGLWIVPLWTLLFEFGNFRNWFRGHAFFMFCLHLPDLMSSPVDFDALRAKHFPKMRRPLMLGSYQSERLNRCIQVLARAASDVCCISLFHMLSTVFVPDRWQRVVNKALLLQQIAEDLDDNWSNL